MTPHRSATLRRRQAGAIDWGIGCFLAVLVAIVVLGWVLVRSLAVDAPAEPASAPPPAAAERDPDRPRTRAQRRRRLQELEVEIERGERELQQLRLQAAQSGVAGGFQAQIEALSDALAAQRAERDALRR